MSVRELARQIGVHHTYISKIELGLVEPPAGHRMIQISQVLNSPALFEAGKRALDFHFMRLFGHLIAVVDQMPPDMRMEMLSGKRKGWEWAIGELLGRLGMVGNPSPQMKENTVKKSKKTRRKPFLKKR